MTHNGVADVDEQLRLLVVPLVGRVRGSVASVSRGLASQTCVRKWCAADSQQVCAHVCTQIRVLVGEGVHACVGASPSARPDDCTRPCRCRLWSACAPLRLHFRVRMIDAPRPPRPTIRAPVAFPSRGSSQSSIVFVASAVIATAAFYCSRQQQPGGSVVTSITSSFVGCHASPAPACGHRPLGSCCRPISNRRSRGGALLLCPRRCRCLMAASCFCARLAALEPIKQRMSGRMVLLQTAVELRQLVELIERRSDTPRVRISRPPGMVTNAESALGEV